MKQWVAIMAAFAVFFLGLGILAPRLNPAPPTPADDVREAVFRSQMARWPSPVYCVGAAGWANNDPSPAFLARFSGVRVYRASDCILNDQGAVVIRQTGERAHNLQVGEITWSGDDAATAGGGYSFAGLGGEGGIFRVVQRNGKWVVVSYQHTWES